MIKLEDKRFLMYVLPRSGSTNLVNMFKSHPEFNNVKYEPFSGNNKIRTLEDFERGFQELRGIDVFKVHANHVGTIPLTKLVLKARPKVLFVYRRNILKCAISHEVGWHTGVWWQDSDWMEYGGNTPSIEFNRYDRIKRTMESMLSKRNLAFEFFHEETINFYPVVYEDFYLAPEEDQVEQLKAILEFLGRSPTINERMLEFLRIPRMNDERGYLNIPNVYEIERMFGSNENGWLLNGGLQL